MVDASIIICTHNPRPHYLDRVLSALRSQELPCNQWELLLVDNASQPPLASHWDLSWHPNARHIRENELGLAAARRRAMEEATAELLVFIDDDNVLANNYVSQALRIKQDWPSLGTWGSGKIIPEFELQPAAHLKPYLPRLALRDYKQAAWSNVLTCNTATPAGAGMCVRANVAKEYRRLYDSETIHLTDRKGNTLLGHGDFEIAFAGCSLGYGMGVFPELRMTHLIPKERVSDEHFLRQAEGNEISGGILAYKWMGKSPPSLFSIKAILSIVKNVGLATGFRRRLYLAHLRGRIAARRAVARYQNATERPGHP
jgi:glycosyltransferase involved in cell wall biosynthesis